MEFAQIALLIVAAASAGAMAKLVKQPLLVGYLFAGLTMGILGASGDTSSLEALGKIGVALLLFLVGLEMNIHELPAFGKPAIITGVGQIIFTTILGLFLASVLGFGVLTGLYIAIALAFSSTIIIVKLLGERRELASLHGRISVGFLLVQDLVAILLLMFLAGLERGEVSLGSYVLLVIKGLILMAGVWWLSQKVLPRLFTNLFDASSELVFIVSIAWALGASALVGGPLGFSLEIGGFLAGVALSNLPEHLQVASRARPLRDFFLTIFFFVLGTHLVIGDVLPLVIPAIILSLFVLVGNPIIVLILMGLMGFRKRTSFMAAITVAQISEFSLIVAAMGVTVGHITQDIVALIVMVAVITMTISTYMILGADTLYDKIKNYLKVFERKKTTASNLKTATKLEKHVVLIGCDRAGKVLLPLLKKTKVIVLDFNPKVIKYLETKGVPHIFGDAADVEMLELLNIGEATSVISTIDDLRDSLIILAFAKKFPHPPVIVMKAGSIKEAIRLYENGADYVIVPDIVAGEHLRHLIKAHGVGSALTRLGKSHFKRIAKV